MSTKEVDETIREHHTIPMPDNQVQQQDQNDNKNIQETKENNGRVSKLNDLLDKKTCANIFYLCWLVLFFLGVASCAVSLSVPSMKGSLARGLAMWQWSLIITALLGGPILSRGLLHITKLIFDHEISLRVNAIYYIVELVQSSLYVLWFSIILLAWIWVSSEPSYFGLPRQQQYDMKKKFSTTKPIITTTLISILIGSILWLIKDLIIIIVKSFFHIKVFFDRIKEVCKHHRAMKALTDGCLCLAPIDDGSKDENVGCSKIVMFWNQLLMILCRVKSKKMAIDKVDLKKTINQEMVSCWNMKVLMNEIATTKFQYKTDKNGKFNMIDSERKAKDVAKNVLLKALYDSEPRDNMSENGAHFKQKLKMRMDEKGASEMYYWFENAGLSYVDKECECKEIITKYMVWVYKYHGALVRGLCDNEALFKELNTCVNLALVITTIVLWFIMAKQQFRDVIIVIGSGIVASAFAFGDFCKKILDTFSFVFLMHPYDAGDYCQIDNIRVIIDEVRLLTTVAITLDNQKIHFPNAILVGKNITNYTRSPPNMSDSVVFLLPRHTTKEEIHTLRTKINSYIKDRSRYWDEEHNLVLEYYYDSPDLEKIKATLYVKHKLNYYEPMETKKRKSDLIEYLNAILPMNKKGNTNSN